MRQSSRSEGEIEAELFLGPQPSPPTQVGSSVKSPSCRLDGSSGHSRICEFKRYTEWMVLRYPCPAVFLYSRRLGDSLPLSEGRLFLHPAAAIFVGQYTHDSAKRDTIRVKELGC